MYETKNNFLNIIKRNKIAISIVFVLILGGVNGILEIAKFFLPDKTSKAFEHIIDEAVKRSMEKHFNTINNDIQDAGDKYSIQLLACEFGRYKTFKELDDRLQYIEDNEWKAQEAAMRIVAASKRAEDKLKKILLDEKFSKRILNKYK
jgi:hypothetical protein